MIRGFHLCGAVLVLTYTSFAQPVASIELSNPPVENNIKHFTVTDPGNEPYTIQTTIGGKACRYIPANKYGYFLVNDAAITPADNNLIFTISFYDAGSGSVSFQYNAANNQNYKSIDINKTNSNKWISATVAVTDASFRNAQNNGADFRLSGDFYVNSISIAKGVLNPASEAVTPVTPSSYSEFIGKSVAGYQAWFSTGTPTSGWVHWSSGTQPAPGNQNFDVYPDVSEYLAGDLTQTGYANLGNGEPSRLFNSSNKTVIDKHFAWMNEAEIDGAALQRFINPAQTVIVRTEESHLLKVKNAAEANNKIFYICYDISSQGLSDVWDDIIKFDWVYNIEQNFGLTGSPAYAKVGNKPVVQIWGLGFTHTPGTAQETIDLINFLKARGCYVIGGLPTYWRTGTQDSKAGFEPAYLALDMISPWSVGRFGDVAGANDFKNNLLLPDKAFCDQKAKAYMPVIFPGFSWATWNNGRPNLIPRKGGAFFWQQALNIKSINVQQMYFAMFDEYDEGTAIMKAATDWSMMPTNQYFVTLGADGIWVSSDFYLRLASAATKLLRGSIGSTPNIPIPYSNGPVYYRNSFESIFAVCKETQYNGFYSVDPCFFNPGLLNSSGVTGGNVVIENNVGTAHSGIFSAKINGSASSASAAVYYYKIADTKITVAPDVVFSFWKYTVNALGRFTSVDLKFKSGKVLRDLPAYKDQTGNSMHPGSGRGTVGAWEKFTCTIGTGELLGDEITEIIIAYDQPNTTGTFTAYFDDILIGINTVTPPLAPSNLLAEAQSTTSMRITWTDNSTNETSFEVQRSLQATSGFFTIQTLPGNTVSYTDTALTPATAYFYRVRAINGGGTSNFSGTATSTTLPLPPAAPNGLTVRAVSDSQVTLKWIDNADNETGFEVQRSINSENSFASVVTTAANVTVLDDTGLAGGTTYFYRVRAVNTGGGSAFSASVNTLVTGWEDPHRTGLVIAYPNPVAEKLVIKNNAASTLSFFILNSLGRLIEQGECATGEEFPIDCSNWSAGIYLVRVPDLFTAIKVQKR